MQLLPEKQSMMTSCVYESSMWLWLQIENCKQCTSCFFFLRNAALAVLVVGETSAFFRQATCSTKSTSSTSSEDMLGQKLQEDQKLRSSKMELLRSSKMELLQQLHFLASTLPTWKKIRSCKTELLDQKLSWQLVFRSSKTRLPAVELSW